MWVGGLLAAESLWPACPAQPAAAAFLTPPLHCSLLALVPALAGSLHRDRGHEAGPPQRGAGQHAAQRVLPHLCWGPRRHGAAERGGAVGLHPSLLWGALVRWGLGGWRGAVGGIGWPVVLWQCEGLAGLLPAGAVAVGDGGVGWGRHEAVRRNPLQLPARPPCRPPEHGCAPPPPRTAHRLSPGRISLADQTC